MRILKTCNIKPIGLVVVVVESVRAFHLQKGDGRREKLSGVGGVTTARSSVAEDGEGA